MDVFKYLLFYITIGIVLSIDAFMAFMAYGLGHHKKHILIITPIAVGSFHIIFPIIAFVLYGVLNLHNYGIGKYFSSTIFICLGLVNLAKKNCTEVNTILSILRIIMLAIAVSVDSLFIGFSLSFNNNIFIAAIIFGIISFTATTCSLLLAKSIYQKISFDFDLLVGLFFIILGILSFYEIL